MTALRKLAKRYAWLLPAALILNEVRGAIVVAGVVTSWLGVDFVWSRF